MKSAIRHLLSLIILSGAAFAWPSCSGQWVSVPKGTTGGTLYSTGDLLFQCQTKTPTPDPKPINSTSTSSSTSTSTASQSQKQGQSQSATATGGQATASNAGQSNAQTTVYENNQVRQAPGAFAPEAFSTAPCRAAGSLGASSPFGGIALGASKKDGDCERATLANGFFARGSNVAGCKLLMKVKVIKKALTFDECMATVVRPAPVAQVMHEVQPSITVNVPAPVVIMPPAPVVAVADKPQVVTVVAPKPHVKRKPTPCPVIVQNGVKIIHEQKGEK